MDPIALGLLSLAVACLALLLAGYAVVRSSRQWNDAVGASGGRSQDSMPLWDVTTNPRELLARLDTESRQALESAAGLALSRQHLYLDIEHWLLRLLQTENGELGQLLGKLSIPVESVSVDLEKSLEQLPSANPGNPSLSSSVLNLLSQAVTVAREDSYTDHVRPGHVLYALVTHPALRSRISKCTQAFVQSGSEPLRTILCRDTEPRPGGAACPACGANVAPTDRRCPSCEIWLS